MEPTPTKETLLVATGMSQGARSYQEDTLDTVRLSPPEGEPGALLVALADGMGGHAGGAKASRMAIDFFRNAARTSEGAVADRLFDGLRAANEAIRDAVAAREGPAGMGCTLVGAHVDPTHVRWISVGDSLLWIWSSSEGLRRLNADHSMSPIIDRMVSQGVISEADAAADPQRHALRSALTGDDITLIDEGEQSWREDQVLIAASDGLLTLTPDQISKICAGSPEDPDRLVRALLAEVDAAADPGQDNTSVIVVSRGDQALPRKTTYSLEDADVQPFPRRTRRAVLAAIALAVAVIAAVGVALLISGGAIAQWRVPGLEAPAKDPARSQIGPAPRSGGDLRSAGAD